MVRPFCPTCRKPLTPEGLLIDIEQAGSERFIKEIGKGAELIWEYLCARGPKCQPKREDAMSLLAKLAQLEQHAKALGKALEIKRAYEISWNQKSSCAPIPAGGLSVITVSNQLRSAIRISGNSQIEF
jgi:hypothetical protein